MARNLASSSQVRVTSNIARVWSDAGCEQNRMHKRSILRAEGSVQYKHAQRHLRMGSGAEGTTLAVGRGKPEEGRSTGLLARRLAVEERPDL